MPNLLRTINMGDCDYGTTDWVELIDTSRQRRTASGVSLSKPRTFSRATDKKMRKLQVLQTIANVNWRWLRRA